jgi:glycosyltransferase involved in cell wall biosynthesis
MPKDRFASTDPIRMLSVLVAAYNEEPTIESALVALHKVLEGLGCDFEIIVVESNSTDRTRRILQALQGQLDFTLYFQEAPLGKGNAIRLAKSKMSGDVFLTYDADAEYDPEDLPKLLDPISSGATSFVLGTRHENGRAMRTMHDHKIRSCLMNLAHRYFTFLINVTFKVKLTDPFTMYKIFRTEVFQNTPLVSDRFDLDWELVAKAIRRGSVPLEIPVRYTSRSFTDGKKVRFFRDPISWLIALIKFRFVKLL